MWRKSSDAMRARILVVLAGYGAQGDGYLWDCADDVGNTAALGKGERISGKGAIAARRVYHSYLRMRVLKHDKDASWR